MIIGELQGVGPLIRVRPPVLIAVQNEAEIEIILIRFQAQIPPGAGTDLGSQEVITVFHIVEGFLREGVGPEHRAPVRLLLSRRQAVQIEPPAEFVVPPFLQGIQKLGAQPFGGREVILQFGDPIG